MSLEKIQQLVNSLAKSVDGNQKIATPILAAKLVNAVNAYPGDQTIGAMSRVIGGLADHNTTFISKAELKALWITGFVPTQQDFADLFDSTILQTAQKTGTVITFVSDSIYGTVAIPETGNITASYTGANLGTTILIIHDTGTEPTYPATWQKISGTYSTTVTNYISAVYLDATHVKYSIYQDA